jgi:hypothetical protein
MKNLTIIVPILLFLSCNKNLQNNNSSKDSFEKYDSTISNVERLLSDSTLYEKVIDDAEKNEEQLRKENFKLRTELKKKNLELRNLRIKVQDTVNYQ